MIGLDTSVMAKDAAKKVSTTIASTDYLVALEYCNARGIEISQLLRECVSERVRQIIAGDEIQKLKEARDQYGGKKSND